MLRDSCKANLWNAKVCILAFSVLTALCACRSTRPGGAGLRITVLDAQRVELAGTVVSWTELDRVVRSRVAEARAAGRDRPPVALNAIFGVHPREMNRIVDLLSAAGVREIDFGPIRR